MQTVAEEIRTTPPTDAELNELLGKPGPPIEVDSDQLAAAVALQRAEAKSGTTASERQRRCAHERFVCKADVGRLTESDGGPVTGYCVDVRILCDECGLPFRWRGLEAGHSVHEPKVSVDGLDLRAPLEPAYVTEIMGMPLKAGTA